MPTELKSAPAINPLKTKYLFSKGAPYGTDEEGDKAQAAAEALRLTAQDLQNLNLIDDVVPEPVGGAHRDPSATIHTLGERIRATLDVLLALDGDELRERRREKFLAMGKSGLN